MPSRRPALAHSHYALLATLRHALRSFLLFSQDAARAAGIPPQQHQALLAIKGSPAGQAATVGALAARLQLRHHSAVGLVDRLARRQLVRRIPSAADGRRVHLALTARGEALIDRLSAIHLRELQQLGPELRRVLALIEKSKRGSRRLVASRK